MPMNPLPPTGAPGAAPVAPAGPGRKEEPGTPDSGFTALLMAMLGAQVMMPQMPAPDQQQAAAGGEGAPADGAVPQAVVSPAAPAGTTLPQQLETLLQAQRVIVSAAPALESGKFPVQPLEDGSWMVEPLVDTVEVAQTQTQAPAPAPAVQAPPLAVAPAPAPAPAVESPAPVVEAFTQGPAQPEQAPAQPAQVQAAATVPQAPAPAVKEAPAPAAEAVAPETQAAAPSVQAPAPSADAGEHREELPQQEAAPVLELPHQVAHAPEVRRPEGVTAAEAPKTPAAIPSPIEPDRLMDAIAKSAVSASDGRYTVTLRLHPEQLGEVRLQLHVAGREVQTTLQVANPEARQLLEQRSDQLRDGLSQSGLTLSGFHVATGQQERQREAREPFEQAGPRRRSRPTGSVTPAGAHTLGPIRLPAARRTTGFDTLA